LVGGEILSAYEAEFSYASSLFTPSSEVVASHQEPVVSQGKWFLDLPTACKEQLLNCGLKEAGIFADPPCTACDTRRFFSHRADAGQCGRMMSVIGILPVTS
jgi:hypothetical protein